MQSIARKEGMADEYRLNRDHSVAVSQEVFWKPMNTCPIAAKVFLLGAGGSGTHGQWNGRDKFWRGWYPMPQVPPGMLD